MTFPASVLADTHCHLMLPEFGSDLPDVLDRARQAGVAWILVPGIDLDSSRQAVALAEAHPGVLAAVGLHPHHATDWDASAAADLRALAAHPRVVAIGEIGLDYYRDRSPRAVQQAALHGQLKLAGELGLPVILHNRQATADLLAAVLPWARSLDSPRQTRAGVLHAYSGEAGASREAVEAGFYLGLGGPITYPNGRRPGLDVTDLPLERVLLETDAPYLPPQPFRGERNEPGHVRIVAEEIARRRTLTLAEVAHATSANASSLFGWTDGNDDSNLL
jgi:TatD DNase family protein